MATMRRFVPYAVATLAVCAVLVPVLRPGAGDSYPLSSYPMFTADRDSEETVAVAVGITSDGDPVRLSPELIAGTDEVIHAAATVSRGVARDTTPLLCDEVADRVGDDRDLVAIEVRSETYDTVRWFDRREPLRFEMHATCPVP